MGLIKTHTAWISEAQYSGQYPDMPEFETPWTCTLQAGQGQGRISADGTPLQSEGLGHCSILLLKNFSTLETALFHSDDWNLNYHQTPLVAQLVHNYIKSQHLPASETDRLIELSAAATRYWNIMDLRDKHYSQEERDYLRARMAELNRDRCLKACFVYGDVSRQVKAIVERELLEGLGIMDSEEILVNTGEVHWAIVYKPKESLVLVDARLRDTMLGFNF
jgi:hypothetical protein